MKKERQAIRAELRATWQGLDDAAPASGAAARGRLRGAAAGVVMALGQTLIAIWRDAMRVKNSRAGDLQASNEPTAEDLQQGEQQQPAADGAAPDQPDQSSTARRLRQSLAELASLRRQVEAMPALEELESLRAKAAKLDELQGVLPELKQQISQAAQAGRAEVDQQLQAERAALAQERQDLALRREFDRAGGLADPVASDTFVSLLRNSGLLSAGEDGALVIRQGESTVPLADGIRALGDSEVFGALFRPTSGSGSGSQGARRIPAAQPDLSTWSKQRLRQAAWG